MWEKEKKVRNNDWKVIDNKEQKKIELVSVLQIENM